MALTAFLNQKIKTRVQGSTLGTVISAYNHESFRKGTVFGNPLELPSCVLLCLGIVKSVLAAMIQLAQYLSGRREYKALFGERPPKAPEIISIWKGLKQR